MAPQILITPFQAELPDEELVQSSAPIPFHRRLWLRHDGREARAFCRASSTASGGRKEYAERCVGVWTWVEVLRSADSCMLQIRIHLLRCLSGQLSVWTHTEKSWRPWPEKWSSLTVCPDHTLLLLLLSRHRTLCNSSLTFKERNWVLDLHIFLTCRM